MVQDVMSAARCCKFMLVVTHLQAAFVVLKPFNLAHGFSKLGFQLGSLLCSCLALALLACLQLTYDTSPQS